MDTSNNKTRSDIPDIRLLVVGAVAGLAIAAIGIIKREDPALPGNAVALVNDTIITREQVERIASRSETAVDAGMIEQMIDEELLLQRGIELGMTRTDGAVRTAIINSLVASVTAEADAANPADDDLQEYLSRNADRFSYVARIEIDAWQTEDESLAQQFATRLRTDAAAAAGAGIEKRRDIPQGLLDIEEFRDLLGPGISASAAGMPSGSIAVFARRGRWVVVRVLAVESAAITDLASIRNRVLLEYRRDMADRQLRDYLRGLRERADVQIAVP